MRIASWQYSAGLREHARAGLDITDTHAHWMVLARRGSFWQVQDHQQWPLRPGWVENGQVLAYSELAEALQQWLAGHQVRDLAMALPPEACLSGVVQAPTGLWPWRRRRWLAARAAELMGRPVAEISWSAHELPGPVPRWRLMAASLDQVQDWLGLAEATGCDCLFLDEAHQAAWRALDRWQEAVPSGTWLFQVGSTCVQALHEQGQRWQWAWRQQDQASDPIPRCLAAVAGASAFVLGQSPLALALQQALSAAGSKVLQPTALERLHWSPDLLWDRYASAYWTALGLADQRGLA